MYIYFILLTHQNLQKNINTDFLNTLSFLDKKIEYLFIKDLLLRKLKPRKTSKLRFFFRCISFIYKLYNKSNLVQSNMHQEQGITKKMLFFLSLFT